MITVSEGAGARAILVESLTNDLCDVAEIAALLTDPGNADTARAALASWSPSRLAQTLVEDMLEG